MDIETLQPGVDFVEAISSAVASSDVLIALIAPDWITATTPSGLRRLDDATDFVRVEIASALKRNVRVIPVLVGGATMPISTDLPGDLQTLARRQAHELSDHRWEFDCQKLIDALSDGLTESAQRAEPHRASDRTRANHKATKKARITFAVGAAIAIVALGGYELWRLTTRQDVQASLDQKVFTVPVIDGFRLDVCLSFGVNCGKPAADEFCKRRAFSEAVRFETETVGNRQIRTKLIGSSEICQIPECAAFTLIQCR